MYGLVHIYTGDGKGKTSAAIGLGIRAYGRGLRVLMVQFLKSIETGEMFAIKEMNPRFTLYREMSLEKFTWEMDAEELETTQKIQKKTFNTVVDAASTGEWDLIIMDEIMAAVDTGLLEKNKVIDFIKNKPKGIELILTGRNAPKEFIELSDYVSEIISIKHPINKGICARKGIEF